MNRPSVVLSGLLPLLMFHPAHSQDGHVDQLADAVSEGSISLDFRYRLEAVDQAGFDDDALASTLRSRITLESAPLAGITALAEIDNVTSIGPDDYNSTENGKTQYPVVADPEYTEFNQALLAWQGKAVKATAGRQRITHLNQRFIGGVAWRQNEQTYDGGRVQWQPAKALNVDISYVANVNRIFGPDDGANPGDLKGDNIFLLGTYALNESHTVNAFAYWLDFDPQDDYAAGKTVNNSSASVGAQYQGKVGPATLRAAYARQSDSGDSELDYSTDYYVLEAGTAVAGVDLKINWEVLAADNGVGFATPLATLHAFQGWADMFLATPGDGIEDLSLSASGSLGPIKLQAIYHDFQAEASSTDFGSEIDLAATWQFHKRSSVQAKYARFDSDDSSRYPDTDKFWVTLQLKL